MRAATGGTHERLSRSGGQAAGRARGSDIPLAFPPGVAGDSEASLPDIAAAARFAITVLLLWELAVRLFGIPTFVLPAPLRFLSVLANRFDAIAAMARQTARSTLIGFAFGVTVGLALGGLIGSSRAALRHGLSRR